MLAPRVWPIVSISCPAVTKGGKTRYIAAGDEHSVSHKPGMRCESGPILANADAQIRADSLARQPALCCKCLNEAVRPPRHACAGARNAKTNSLKNLAARRIDRKIARQRNRADGDEPVERLLAADKARVGQFSAGSDEAAPIFWRNSQQRRPALRRTVRGCVSVR